MAWVVLGILVVAALSLVGIYNSLVRLNVQCDNAWADIAGLVQSLGAMSSSAGNVMQSSPRSSGGSGFGSRGGGGFSGGGFGGGGGRGF